MQKYKIIPDKKYKNIKKSILTLKPAESKLFEFLPV